MEKGFFELADFLSGSILRERWRDSFSLSRKQKGENHYGTRT